MRNTVNLKLNLLDDSDVFDYIYVNQNNEILDKEFGNLFDNKSEYVVTTGNANIYLATLEGITGYYEGLCLKIKIHVDSTGKCTLNVNSLGAKYIKDSYGNIVTNLRKDIPYHVCYNGSDFILLGKGGGGNATTDKILNGYTATVDCGLITGTMKNNGTKIFTPGRSNIALSGFYGDGTYIKGEPNLIPNNIMRDRKIFDVTGNCDLSDYAKNQLNNAITKAGGTIGSDLSSILNGIGGLTTLGSNVIQIPSFSFTGIEKEDTKVTQNEAIGNFTISVTKWWHKYSTKSYYASYTFPVDVKAKISVNSRQNYVGAENMTIRTKRMDIVIEWHSSNTTIDDSRRNTNSINSINFAYYDYDRNLNEMDNKDVIVFY